MENEAYLDELDRELAEYNRERTGAKLKPAEKDGGFETARYVRILALGTASRTY